MTLPTGTVTFLFTDIEGSTRLVNELGERYHLVLDHQAKIIRHAVGEFGGHEVSTEGDSFFVVFTSAAEAVLAAAAAQRAIAAHEWPDDRQVRVRMGLHSGRAIFGGDNYMGIDVHRGARIAAVANGGQVLLSKATVALAEGSSDDLGFADLGLHRLKDIARAERIFQLVGPGLQRDFPPLARALETPNNLPGRQGLFVGRGRELDQLEGLLVDHRLVTLTGPGGSGKTSLVIELGHRFLSSRRDGVFFVALGDITDPGLVGREVAATIGVYVPPGVPPEEAVVERMGDAEVLLILDNFEQVIAAAPVVSTLLNASGVKVLVTSREALRVSVEQDFPVPPLPVPPADPEPAVEDVANFEAVELFVKRARLVDPSFRLTHENAGDVASICVQLDGLPLAIELGAARIRLMKPRQLRQRLPRLLDLIPGSARDVPHRQKTLRAAIEWSHDLLEESERVVFRRLSVFAGGWTLEAAEEVVQTHDVLSHLASLIDKNLVSRGPDEDRLRMLHTIREFALHALSQAGEENAQREQHALYFLGVAQSLEDDLIGPKQEAAVAAVSADIENFREALKWAISEDRSDIALAITSALRHFWTRSRFLGEGVEWLNQALALTSPEPLRALRGRALTAAADIAGWAGEIDSPAHLARQAVEIFRAEDDLESLTDALIELGAGSVVARRLDDAQAAFGEALTIAREQDEVRQTALALAGLGVAELADKRLRKAKSHLAEAKEAFAAFGDDFFSAFTARCLGYIEALEGRYSSARELYEEALRKADANGFNVLIATILDGYARLALGQEDYIKGGRLAGSAGRLRETGGVVAGFNFTEDDVRADLERAVGQKEAEAAIEEGRALTLEEVVRYALEPEVSG